MYYEYPQPNHDDSRFFPFLAPVLLGGLGGFAIGAASRPRPYPVPYYPMPYRPPMPVAPMPPMSYSSSTYNVY